MRNMFDQVFRRHQPAAIDPYQQDLYTKFRVLGANIDRLKQLELAVPELEQLLERLERVHDKTLVRFITDIAQFHAPAEKHASKANSRDVLKTCPRCTRELTETNVIKDHQSDDNTTFVLVCECGYVREIRSSSIKVAARQSHLDEYRFFVQNVAAKRRNK